MQIHHKSDYRPLRRERYPQLGDQLDAILALARALKEQGVAIPEQTQRWMDACAEVKRRYPKS